MAIKGPVCKACGRQAVSYHHHWDRDRQITTDLKCSLPGVHCETCHGRGR